MFPYPGNRHLICVRQNFCQEHFTFFYVGVQANCSAAFQGIICHTNNKAIALVLAAGMCWQSLPRWLTSTVMLGFWSTSSVTATLPVGPSTTGRRSSRRPGSLLDRFPPTLAWCFRFFPPTSCFLVFCPVMTAWTGETLPSSHQHCFLNKLTSCFI